MAAKPTTFESIDLKIDGFKASPYPEFVTKLRAELLAYKDKRFAFFELQQRNSKWVNIVRRSMVWFGSAGVFATALAAGVRIYSLMPGPLQSNLQASSYDVTLLVIAVVLYAAMGAALFFERTAEGVGSYFRSIVAILAIRDLWNAYEFKAARLAAEPAPKAPEEELAAKKLYLDEAYAFCKALDTITTQELTEWRGAFQTSMTQLSTAATTGLAASQTALSEAIKADVATAKAAADEAKRAAEAAKEATRSAALNVTIVHAAAGTATITVDDQEVAKGLGRSFAISGQSQGLHKVRVEVAGAGGAPPKAVEENKIFGAGINVLTFTPI